MRDRNQLRRPACCNVQGERGSERRRPRSLRGSGAPLATHDVLFGWRNRVKDFLALKVADGRWIVLSLVSRAAPRNLWLACRANAPTLCWLATKRLYRRETAYTLSEASARDWNLVRGECRWALILVFGRSKNWVFFLHPWRGLDGCEGQEVCVGAGVPCHGEDDARKSGITIGNRPGNANSRTDLYVKYMN